MLFIFFVKSWFDFRTVVIKYSIDETTKVRNVNKYFNFIIQKLTIQARKKLYYFKLICKIRFGV